MHCCGWNWVSNAYLPIGEDNVFQRETRRNIHNGSFETVRRGFLSAVPWIAIVEARTPQADRLRSTARC